MKRIYKNGNLYYFQNNLTGSFEAYPVEEIILKKNNGRYYFSYKGATIQSQIFANILDRNGNPFSSEEEFELSISKEDAVEGYAVHRIVSAADLNPHLIKTGKTMFHGGIFTNSIASDLFVKYYNKATVPTVGTDIPVLTIAVPASDTKIVEIPKGIEFLQGLGIGMTVEGEDDDTTAIAAIADLIAQTFLEGLEKTDVIGVINTNSATVAIITATGKLIGVIESSGSTVSFIEGDGFIIVVVNTSTTTVGILIGTAALNVTVNDSKSTTVSVLIDQP